MASPMDKLPEELLYLILQHAQNSPNQRSFIKCLLCCRLWYKVGLPLFCQGVKLRNWNIMSFIELFPRENLAMVKFLTLSIRASFDPVRLARSGSYTDSGLLQLSRLLPKMINLSTLSFTYSDMMMGHPRPLFMPRSTVEALVENLPMSCVNLQIDTHGLDQYVYDQPHLCRALRQVLPRLQHLRLRLSDLCPGIFATGFKTDGTMADESEICPVIAPNLKTLVINCCVGIWTAGACGIRPRIEAHNSLIERLHEFAACGSFPAIERLWLVYKPRIEFVAPQYLCYKRCDIIQNQTLSIPYIYTSCQYWAGIQLFLMRKPDGQQIIAEERRVEQYVEDQMWKYTRRECRVPSAVMKKLHDESEKPVPVWDMEAMKAVQCSCAFHLLWYNEEASGTVLMNAVLSEGSNDESPMMVGCPAGWKWVGRYLEPEDGPSSSVEDLVSWATCKSSGWFCGDWAFSNEQIGSIHIWVVSPWRNEIGPA